jgi:DNA gyrase subunit A
MTNGKHHIMLAVKSGRAIRFPEESVRPMGRTASGVRGIRLANETTDFVIGMITVENKEKDILVVAEKGYGKRSSIEDYRITNRGGKGVKTINITEKTGSLIALKDVTDNHDLMIITQFGNILRSPVSALRVMGRATQGVRLINLKENDIIASVAEVLVSEDEDGADIDNIEENKEIAKENGKEFDD